MKGLLLANTEGFVYPRIKLVVRTAGCQCEYTKTKTGCVYNDEISICIYKPMQLLQVVVTVDEILTIAIVLQ